MTHILSFLIGYTKDELIGAHYPELTLAWMKTIPSGALSDNGKYSGIFINCPVDITVYANNALVLQIINDEIITYEDSPIQALIDSDGQKIVSVPGDVQASV